MIRKIFLLNMILLFLACSKQQDKGSVVKYEVTAEFQPLVSGFIQEAAIHGDTLVIDNLIIKYDSSQSNQYCAVCNTTSLDPAVQKIITVNPKVHCYNNFQEKEALFFHEMGHCILGRSHDNRLLPNGDPRSIMVPDNLKLYDPCLYPLGGSCKDNRYKRDYYIKELFNEQTPVPDWGH